jgi:hypothetical protein
MDLPRTLDEAHLVFDVDGILTDEFARVDLQVMRLMNKKLIGARLLGFVTGRAAPWFDSHIASHSGHLDSARRVPRAAETGPVLWNGPKWRTGPAYVAPAELRATLKGLVDHPPYEGPIEWDGSEQATITAEAVHARTPGHAAATRWALRACGERAGRLPPTQRFDELPCVVTVVDPRRDTLAQSLPPAQPHEPGLSVRRSRSPA